MQTSYKLVKGSVEYRLNCTLAKCKTCQLQTYRVQKLILANTAKHQTKDARIHHHKCEYATCKYPQTCQGLSGIGFQLKYCQNSTLAYHWNATIPECKVVNNQLATRKIAKMHANWMKYRWQISHEETAKAATLQGWIYSRNLEPICYFGQINVETNNCHGAWTFVLLQNKWTSFKLNLVKKVCLMTFIHPLMAALVSMPTLYSVDFKEIHTCVQTYPLHT